MNNHEKLSKLKEEDYQELFGVKKKTFDEMLKVLEEAYDEQCQRGGRPLRALSILDKLVILLQYYREYRTMQHIAYDYSVSKTAVWKSIRWAEETLVRSKKFALPSKKKLVEKGAVKAVVMDVTECEIERPKKNRNYTILGRKSGIR